MKYFSGFCLCGEEALFKDVLKETKYTTAGFSYGAILAFEEAFTCKERIDTLQLISPAFFQTKEAKFKKLQTLYFTKDEDAYVQTFLDNIAFPSSFDMNAFKSEGSVEELHTLLHYEWSEEKLQALVERGVHIEVYLGEEDKIIDAKCAREFFTPYATVYYIKSVGHILRSQL